MSERAKVQPKHPEPRRFQVVREFSGHKPGDVIEEGRDWPFHRAMQLTNQRFIMPLDQTPETPRRAQH